MLNRSDTKYYIFDLKKEKRRERENTLYKNSFITINTFNTAHAVTTLLQAKGIYGPEITSEFYVSNHLFALLSPSLYLRTC